MRHADLQYRWCSACACDSSPLRATPLVVIERGIERQRPAALQISQHIGQAFEPCRTQWGLLAASREPTWDSQCHGFHCSRFTSAISKTAFPSRGTLRADDGKPRSYRSLGLV